MRLLIDTNILIPLEPTRPEDMTGQVPGAAELLETVQRGGHQILIHPDSRLDLDRDRDDERRQMRDILLTKYSKLESPPSVSPELAVHVGNPIAGTNDWVDNRLLAAVAADAVHYLITEDRRLTNKARRAGLSERVATVAEALTILRSLFDTANVPPPSIRHMPSHQLVMTDRIFESLRDDYPEFDSWLRKVKMEGRECRVVPASDGYAAICILKNEDDNPFGLRGKVLKICTFKVSADHEGHKYGELLLKDAFEHCRANNYAFTYLTAHNHHEGLIALLEDFGFRALPQSTPSGERVFVKRFIPEPFERRDLMALEYHVLFGPAAVKWGPRSVYAIPIQPKYAKILFPESELAESLFGPEPSGNAIRKAYLCNSQSRQLRPGDAVLFYRSYDFKAVIAAGVVESTQVSGDPDRIAASVGKRTVYPYSEIVRMAQRGEILAILFRQARILEVPISIAELTANRALRGSPQSISRIREEAFDWISQRVAV